MVNSQEWLNNKYPPQGSLWNLIYTPRSSYTELKIVSTPYDNEEIEGHLDLSDFEGLEELSVALTKITSINLGNNFRLTKFTCFLNSRLTSIDISGCPNLLYLYCPDNSLTSLNLRNNGRLTEITLTSNNFTRQTLDFLGHLTDLKKLYLGAVSEGSNNRFYGSLRSLSNMSRLEELGIANTNIGCNSSNLECLPNNLEVIKCHGCPNLDEELNDFKKHEGDGIYSYNFRAWRERTRAQRQSQGSSRGGKKKLKGQNRKLRDELERERLKAENKRLEEELSQLKGEQEQPPKGSGSGWW